MSFLMFTSLDSEDRRELGVRGCNAKGASRGGWSERRLKGKPEHELVASATEHILDPCLVS